MFENEYQTKETVESEHTAVSINDTDEVGVQLSQELLKKKSFKEIFNFDNFQLMKKRIAQ